MIYGNYTTLAKVRQKFIGATETTDDALINDFIEQVSRMIDSAGKRHFYPLIETRHYDIPYPSANIFWTRNTLGYNSRDKLVLDDDLLAIDSVTNGDDTTISATNYLLYPANRYPKFALKLKDTSNVAWQRDASGNHEQVIEIAGTWGYSKDYTNQWQNNSAVLDASGISSTSATSANATHGKISAGDLIKIDSEILYVSEVNAGATVDALVIVRGANGSTAATHAAGASVLRWAIDAELVRVATHAVVAMYRLRQNPIPGTVQIEAETYASIQDVSQWLGKEMARLGIVREVFG